MHKNSQKTLVIGLDGASLDLVTKWKDKLPNISKLMDEGAWGKLESTIPPITIPAWCSFASGKTPQSLGFFDFRKINFSTKKTRLIRGEDWGPAIWDVFSDNNLRVGVVNFPGTYPPKKVNGFMISGFLSPSTQNIFYPKSLEKIVNRIVKDYKIYPDTNPYITNEQKYLDNVYKIFTDRLKITEHLISNSEWILFVVVFMVLDWIQHYFWKHMDSEHPLHEPNSPYRNSIKRSYIMVDSAVGHLASLAGENTNILLVSDHGFGKLRGLFFVNTWLAQKGYFYRKESFFHTGSSFVNTTLKSVIFSNFVKKLNLNFATIGSRIKYDKIFEKLFHESADDPFVQEISHINMDPKRTKAFGFGYYNKIYLNLRERGGCVRFEDRKTLISRIVEDLNILGRKSEVELKIFTKGRNLKPKNEPDIIYFINDGEYIQSNRFSDGPLWESTTEKSGDHRLYGMWVLKGPNVKRASNKQVRIYDLAPTIYYLHSLQSPAKIDGVPIRDVFESSKSSKYNK